MWQGFPHYNGPLEKLLVDDEPIHTELRLTIKDMRDFKYKYPKMRVKPKCVFGPELVVSFFISRGCLGFSRKDNKLNVEADYMMERAEDVILAVLTYIIEL